MNKESEERATEFVEKLDTFLTKLSEEYEDLYATGSPLTLFVNLSDGKTVSTTMAGKSINLAKNILAGINNNESLKGALTYLSMISFQEQMEQDEAAEQAESATIN